MRQQKTDPEPVPETTPDLFDEPRDHANRWDVTALWEEEGRVPETRSGPVAE